MNLPNKLTLVRAASIPVFLFFLLGHFPGEAAGNWLALVIFAAAALTDALDGHIARKYNLITNFGKFMDPLADKLLVSAALIAFVGMGRLAAWVVIVIISRELVITGFRVIAADNRVVLAAGNSGKLKTVLQMIMIIYIMPDFKGSAADLIKNVLVCAAALATVYSAAEYIWRNRWILSDEK